MKDIDDEVAKLRQKYISAVAARNVTALVQLYDPKARIFDAWGVWEYKGTESWQVAIEGWFSSTPNEKLLVTFNDCSVLGDADLATMTAVVTYAAVAPNGTESHSMQNRITWTLRTVAHNLRIVHEHTSAPIGFEDMKAILKKQA
jgi:ketosteroid isomerase-like protein